MGPGFHFAGRRGWARRVAALGPSRRVVAIRLAHVAGGAQVGPPLRWWHVSRRGGPPDRTSPYDPPQRLDPCFGRGQRSGRTVVFGDPSHDAGHRNAIDRPGGTEQSRWHLVSHSPGRRTRRLAGWALYDQLPDWPGLDRLAKDLAARRLSVPVGSTGEGGGALQGRAAGVALPGEWRERPGADGNQGVGSPSRPVHLDGTFYRAGPRRRPSRHRPRLRRQAGRQRLSGARPRGQDHHDQPLLRLALSAGPPELVTGCPVAGQRHGAVGARSRAALRL